MIKIAKSKYLDIYNFIKENIQNEVYLPEEKIPSENELKDLFGVSRNTVRRAIDMLSSDGLLSSVHGKGVFVMKKIPINFLLGGTESFKEATLKNDLKYKTTVPIFEILIVDESINKKTHFPVGKIVYHIVRIRNIDNENVILDENYFLEEITGGLNVTIAMDSIYEFLENKKKLKISGAQKVISIENSTKLDNKYLDLNDCRMVVLVKNYAYLDSGIYFEYTESHHRPDKFIFRSYAKRLQKQF